MVWAPCRVLTPGSVGEVLYSMDELAPHLSSFRLISREGHRHNKALEVAIELGETSCPEMLDRAAVGHELFERLAAANGDFRNAYARTATSGQLPEVTLHRRGTGPFAGPDRIKHQYVATAVVPDRL